MAKVIAVSPPVNDSERRAIAHLRDHLPSTCTVVHNFEIRVDKDIFEIDLAIIAPHCVFLVDVKGTFGQIDIYGNKWYPAGRPPFPSPLAKLRQHAKAFKNIIVNSFPGQFDLKRIHVHAAVLLTSPDARVEDHAGLDGPDIVPLGKSLVYFMSKQHVPENRNRDIAALLPTIQKALLGKARPTSGPVTFRDWQIEQKLGGDDHHTDYRARHTFLGRSGGSVRLRVYHVDPLELDPTRREAQRYEISTAFRALAQLPPHPNITAVREFFQTDGGDEFVLVTEDAAGHVLRQHLVKAALAQTFDQKLRVMRDTLSALAHAHANRVIHRNLTPDAILVGVDGRIRLGEFDYARTLADPNMTIGPQIAGRLDPTYTAPECVVNPSQATERSDLFSAGLVFYHLLAGRPAFADSGDMLTRHAVFETSASAERPGLPPALDHWLQKLCAFQPDERFTGAIEAASELNVIVEATPAIAPSTKSSPHATTEYDSLQRGTLLADRFVVQEALGQPGSFGVAYKVFDTFGDVARVLKLILKNRGPVLDRLRQEYKALSNLPDHPNVVKVIWADRLPPESPNAKPIPYLVFEFLDGYTVKDFLTAGALSLQDAQTVAIQVSQGLVHLHQHRVYHQDIKPSNLLWTDQGVRIIDFNVALTAEDDAFSGGTRRYLPPDSDEVVDPSESDKADRDLYSLGITFYECATGHYPFENDAPIARLAPRDPREFENLKDLNPDWARLLIKAISPNRTERFRTAREYLTALQALPEPRLVVTVGAENLPPAIPSMGQVYCNPFVGNLLTLYSQSKTSNAGTRGLDDFSKLLYVDTLLDTQLRTAVLAGEFRLVIITGNAGDGKTAFIQQVENYAQEQGAQVSKVINGARFRFAGKTFVSNYDGSQDEGERGNTQVLQDFFAPFEGRDTNGWPSQNTHLIAINEGRLIEFLDEQRERFQHLGELVRQGLGGGASDNRIAVINLNLRAVVADTEGPTSSIFDRLIRRMVAPEFWQACQGCDIRDRCYIHHNVRTLSDPVAGPRVIERLRTLYTAAHLRGRLHITLRDLRSSLAFILVGTRDCEQTHALYQRGPEALPEILDCYYFNAWRGGAKGSADRLIGLLSEMDMGEVSTPDLDRRLAFLQPTAQRLSRYAFSDRGDYDDKLFQRLFNDLSLLPHDGNFVEHLTSHRHYVGLLRRRYFFECRDERPDTGWLSLLPYRHLRRFGEIVNRPESLLEEIEHILEAINRGEGLTDPARLSNQLALRVRAVERGTIRSYRLFNGGEFEPGSTVDPVRRRFLEYMPTGVRLRYQSSDTAHTTELAINLDVYEMLNRLNAGYQPSLEEQQGFYRTLVVFKNVLASAPYQEVLLTETGHDFYRVRREIGGVLTFTAIKDEELRGNKMTDGAVASASK